MTKQRIEKVAAPPAPWRWREGKWGEQVNYECLSCPYDTIERERIEEHVKVHELTEPPPEPKVEEVEYPWPSAEAKAEEE